MLVAGYFYLKLVGTDALRGFDWGQIGPILNALMDTDRMDITRRVSKVNSDGSAGTAFPGTPIWEAVPCHIAFHVPDKANPTDTDNEPILATLTLHCALSVDLQNGDTVTAYRLSTDGGTLAVYRGTVGKPKVSMGRQSVELTVVNDG